MRLWQVDRTSYLVEFLADCFKLGGNIVVRHSRFSLESRTSQRLKDEAWCRVLLNASGAAFLGLGRSNLGGGPVNDPRCARAIQNFQQEILEPQSLTNQLLPHLHSFEIVHVSLKWLLQVLQDARVLPRSRNRCLRRRGSAMMSMSNSSKKLSRSW